MVDLQNVYLLIMRKDLSLFSQLPLRYWAEIFILTTCGDKKPNHMANSKLVYILTIVGDLCLFTQLPLTNWANFLPWCTWGNWIKLGQGCGLLQAQRVTGSRPQAMAGMWTAASAASHRARAASRGRDVDGGERSEPQVLGCELARLRRCRGKVCRPGSDDVG